LDGLLQGLTLDGQAPHDGAARDGGPFRCPLLADGVGHLKGTAAAVFLCRWLTRETGAGGLNLKAEGGPRTGATHEAAVASDVWVLFQDFYRGRVSLMLEIQM
jgi:hypothetical protein